jgi:hypothetical protein
MKTQKAGWLLFGIGLFLITSGLVLGTAVTVALANTGGAVGMDKVAAEVNPVWKGGETLDLEMIEKLREEFGPDQVAYAVETVAAKQTKDWSGKRIDAVVAGADSNYGMFHGFDFLDGGFLLAESPGAVKTVVISEALAWALFRTTRAAGMELEVYGKPFRITGVFRCPDDILHTLVKPGLPDVFLPAESMLALDDQAYVASVEVAVGDSVIFGGNTERVNAALRRTGADTARFTVTDFAAGRKSIAQKPVLIAIAAGFITVLLSTVHLIKAILGFIREMWKAHRECRRSAWLKRGLRLILPAAVIAALVLLWHHSNFKPYVPAEYLPGETLDGQKYQELLQEGLRRAFSGIREGASLNVRLFQAAGLLSGTIFRIAAYAGTLLAFAGMTALNHAQLAGNAVKTGTCQIAALLAACGLCWKSGLPVQVHTEGILVLWTSVAACLMACHAKQNSGCAPPRLVQRAGNTP